MPCHAQIPKDEAGDVHPAGAGLVGGSSCPSGGSGGTSF